MAGPQGELVFAPLGGVGEIGMNLAIYGLGDQRRRSDVPSCRSSLRLPCMTPSADASRVSPRGSF